MAAPIPTEVPAKIIAGDTKKWNIDLSDYPASDGWVLTYELRGPQVIDTITATTTNDTFNVVITAATTVLWPHGVYSYQAYVTLSGERWTVDSGFLLVDNNLETTTGAYDGRSDFKTSLDALDATLAGTATRTQSQMQIAGQMVTYMTTQDKTKLRDWLATQYQKELDQTRRDNGKAGSHTVGVRFKNV